MASKKEVRIPPPSPPTTSHENRVYINTIIKLAQSATIEDIPILNALGLGANNRTKTPSAQKHIANFDSDKGNFLRLIRAAKNLTPEKVDEFRRHGQSLAYKLEGDGSIYKSVESEVLNLIERMRAIRSTSGSTINPPATEFAADTTPIDESPVSNEPDPAQGQPQSAEPLLLSSPEGKRLLKLHSKRERNPKLAKEKKRIVQAECSCLKCVVCDFDFSERYGTHGDGFIECHHTKPLSDRREEEETLLEDLELVCANCHRMLHRGKVMLSIAELRAKLRSVD